jgi:hypothetical protein
MGRRQTDTPYLLSVLLWLAEYWSGPPVYVYPVRTAQSQSSPYGAGPRLRMNASMR